jgi:hypothetical protein
LGQLFAFKSLPRDFAAAVELNCLWPKAQVMHTYKAEVRLDGYYLY